jgi:hypothetical protein
MAPFPSSSGCVSWEARRSVKGGLFLAGLRTLDRSPCFLIIRTEGKGAGGLRGLAPWRSMRQRLWRASARRPPCPIPFSLRFSAFSLEPSSARLSFALVSPCFHPHSVAASTVPLGVLNTRGAAISEAICGVPAAWFPTISRDLAVTPTRRFRISRRFRSFPKASIRNARSILRPLLLSLVSLGC